MRIYFNFFAVIITLICISANARFSGFEFTLVLTVFYWSVLNAS